MSHISYLQTDSFTFNQLIILRGSLIRPADFELAIVEHVEYIF